MEDVRKFLINSRAKTYAAGTNKVAPLLPGSVQYEVKDDDWLYRDVYFIGNSRFAGLETVYRDDKPVWSMSYYGNFEKVTEEEVDKILRVALTETVDTTRLNTYVTWSKDNYEYVCEGSGKLEEADGSETIKKDGQQIYFLYYAAGYLG